MGLTAVWIVPTMPPMVDREELHRNWMGWVTTNLGRDTRLAELAARAATDAAEQGRGFNSAADAARIAWADAAKGSPPATMAPVVRPKGHAGRNFALGCVAAVLFLPIVGLLVISRYGGGYAPDLNDTWTWDGKDWSQVKGSSSPPWRTGAVFVYSDASKEILLFGGDRSGDTWTFDGVRWMQRHPIHSPGPTSGPGPLAAYDPVGRQVIMLTAQSETWSWADGDWQQLQPANSPPASPYWDSLLFDPTKSRLTLFGYHPESVQSPTWILDTWIWENSNWTPLPTTTNFQAFALRFTDVNAGVIKTAPGRAHGFYFGPSPMPIAQSWNGSDWVGGQPADWMPTTAGGGYTFYPPRGYLLTFGGDTCLRSHQDIFEDDQTWTWDGSVWTLLQPKTNPPPRSMTYLAYATAVGRVVMFGGYVRGTCGGIPI